MLATDTFDSLPPFANQANKALSSAIKTKENKLNELLVVLDDNTSRADAMSTHMKNVQQELAHTQALYDAKGRQIESEDHFKQLAERESGRLAMEIKRMEKDVTDISDHLTTIQNNIYRGNEKIEAIRTELRLEKEELDEWLRVQSEKEEDNMALLKYSKEDDIKIKALSLQIEKLMQEVNKKKSNLSAEVTETQVAQMELEKTTESFKELHNERQELITNWENTIKSMQDSDKRILEIQEEYQKSKSEIREKQAIIDEKQAFLDQQLQNNVETEKKIGLFDRQVSKYKLEQTEENTSLIQFKDEVEVMKNTLSKTATDLINKRAEIVNLKNELLERQNRFEIQKQLRVDAKNKLAMVTSDTMSLEQKAQQLQEMIKQEESKNKELDRELKILRGIQFKQNQELFRLKQQEKNLSAEITGGEAAAKNLQSKIIKLDQEALKQQALLYAQEFQIQQLERKVRRAQGDRTDEEKEILIKKIEALNQELEMQNQKWVLLNTQLKKSQGDLREAKRTFDTLDKEKNGVIEAIDSLKFYNESATNQLSSKIKEKEEQMVEESILRLELRKLRGFLNVRADEVFTLENRQVQLQCSMEERTKEIEIHKDMLRLKIKNAEEERHSANSELRDRIGKVEKLKRRYEILTTQFAPQEGEEEHSQAFYVIKAAQQREELQREGDELDAKIRKAEKEIKGLENTLKLMNDRNEEYRMNLYKSELNSTDLQHKEMLELEYKSSMEKYKIKRQEIQDLQQQLVQLERSLSSITYDEGNRMQAIQALESRLVMISKELDDQRQKRERAYKQVHKMTKDLRKGSGNAYTATNDELDIMIREHKEVSSMTLNELNKLSERYPGVAVLTQQLFSAHGVLPVSRNISRVPSRAESLRDDVSEASSEGAPRRKPDDLVRQYPKSISRPSSSRATSVAGERHSDSAQPKEPTSSRNGSANQRMMTMADEKSRPTSVTSQQSPMATMNMNAAVSFPTPQSGKSTTQVGAGTQQGVSSTSSTPIPRGKITGSGRIKGPARPGSATSMSSHGSGVSRNSSKH